MTNKPAPYNNPATLQYVLDWWTTAHPTDTASPTSQPEVSPAMALFLDFDAYTGQLVWSPNYLAPNQFAKCLVALHITDIGNGTYALLPTWEPKPYEIARAKATS